MNGFGLDILVPYGNGHTFTRNNARYFALPHKSEYAIRLHNNNSTVCDTDVFVDDVLMGTWRINAYGKVDIERPEYATKRFVFLRETSLDAIQTGAVPGKEENGLIKAVFKPAKRMTTYQPLREYEVPEQYRYNVQSRPPSAIRNGNVQSPSMNKKSVSFAADNTAMSSQSTRPSSMTRPTYSGGVTVLGEHSHQQFDTVLKLRDDEIDWNRVTTIIVRLVVSESGNSYPPRV